MNLFTLDEDGLHSGLVLYNKRVRVTIPYTLINSKDTLTDPNGRVLPTAIRCEPSADLILITSEFLYIDSIYVEKSNSLNFHNKILACSQTPMPHALCVVYPQNSVIKLISRWPFMDQYPDPPEEYVRYLYKPCVDTATRVLSVAEFQQICGSEIVGYQLDELLRENGFDLPTIPT